MFLLIACSVHKYLMDNLYEILQSSPGASTEELRKAYIRLARLYHPDKNNQTASDDTSSSVKEENTMKFTNIDRAWKMLSNPQLRAQFDARWHEHILAQDLPIQDTVPFEDFDHDDKDDMYTHPCRCGGSYLLSEIDFQLHFDIVYCDTCSLTIKEVATNYTAATFCPTKGVFIGM